MFRPLVSMTLVAGLLAAGCTGTTSAEPEPAPADGGAPAPSLVLGTGASGFETLTDGDEVELTPGFQGGHHVWGGLRAKDLDPDGVTFHLGLEVDGAEVASMGYETALWPVEGDPEWMELWGITVILDGARVPESLDGTPGVFTGRVEDRNGVVYEARVDVTVRCCAFGGVGNGPPDGGLVDGAPPDAGPRGGGAPPTLGGILAVPERITPGGDVHLEAIAHDPEGDTLAYTWSAEAGTLEDEPVLDYGKIWNAPADPGTYRIEVAVSDGASTVRGARTVEVLAP